MARGSKRLYVPKRWSYFLICPEHAAPLLTSSLAVHCDFLHFVSSFIDS